jgi:hypothetical protein
MVSFSGLFNDPTLTQNSYLDGYMDGQASVEFDQGLLEERSFIII